MLSDARLRSLIHDITPILLVITLVEVVTARIIGRLSFLFSKNPVIFYSYQVGVFAVRVVTLLSFIMLFLLAIGFMRMGRNDKWLLSILGISIILLVIASLTLPYLTYYLALINAGLILLLTIGYVDGRRERILVILTIAPLVAGVLNILYNLAIIRLVSEILMIAYAFSLFVLFMREGRLGIGATTVSVGIPVILLIAPKYSISYMPWIIRQVSAFSMGYLLTLPIEIYAVALALFLMTVFKIGDKLVRSGLLFILLGGLPSWSIYPLLLYMMGLSMILYSLITRKQS